MVERNCKLSVNKLSFPREELESEISLKSNKSSLLSSCRICLSSIFDPASLTCGHRFCERCLNTYWHIRDKPDYIVCPLCRGSAFNVEFTEKAKLTSTTQEFRKTFDPEHFGFHEPDLLSQATGMFLKISIIVPAIYFMTKFLKPAFVDLLFHSGYVWA